MPIAVIADKPIPVSSRAAKSPAGSQAKALRKEKALNQATAAISARLRPT
jgi:hypothetical protein